MPGFAQRLTDAGRTLNLLAGINEEVARVAATHRRAWGALRRNRRGQIAGGAIWIGEPGKEIARAVKAVCHPVQLMDRRRLRRIVQPPPGARIFRAEGIAQAQHLAPNGKVATRQRIVGAKRPARMPLSSVIWQSMERACSRGN